MRGLGSVVVVVVAVVVVAVVVEVVVEVEIEVEVEVLYFRGCPSCIWPSAGRLREALRAASDGRDAFA